MQPKILVSACLLGRPVRYDGKGLFPETDRIGDWNSLGWLVQLCPEVAAGFPTPRPPAEIEPNATSSRVLEGKARIFEDTGKDVTDAFLLGADIAVQTAKQHNCKFALLTDGSPSCGSTFVYNGTFDGTRQPGTGVVAQALRMEGVEVFSLQTIEDLAARLHPYNSHH
ncbi:MAG: DUF523 domain-containing protein [Pseudomonadota bacterium]